MAPRVYVTADTQDFNKTEMENLAAEGYDVAFVKDFKHLEDGNDKYCIIAYGTAALFALEFATTPVKWLAGLVAFYPTGIPTRPFCPNVNVLLHLPDSQPLGPPDAGDDGKANMKYRLYLNTRPGFAEPESIHYDKVQAGIAYSRTLSVLRKAIGPEVDLEEIWENHMFHEFVNKDVEATMRTMVKEPYVNHIPTIAGGIGYRDLHRFYKDFFIPNNPNSLSFSLVSRTVGTDRIVDELVVSFKHDREIPWMLPGIAPTGKDVTVALVSIVCVRGGLLYHEHIYWDQATVLAQIGLIDKSLLPVAGKESAMKVLDKDSVPSNEMLKGWKTADS